jgi:hypothetical protein
MGLAAAGLVSHAGAQIAGNASTAPGITLQNLPTSQQAFRVRAVRAVDHQIYAGAVASLATYGAEPPVGWRVIRIPRTSPDGGRGESVFHLRVSSPEKIVDVAIRGTANFDDLLVDLNAAAQLDEELQIPLHAGFRSVARDVYGAIQRELSDTEIKTYGFRLFGHSLGGAAASIVSMYLHQAGLNVELVATYGAPRFTTNEGARKYQVLNQRTFRIVRCDDAVPFLPPPNFFGWSTGSYEANGNIILLLAPPYFDYSAGTDIERDFVHQLRSELSSASGRSELAFGHRMKNYTDLLMWFTGSGIQLRSRPTLNEPADIRPIAYTLALQSRLCPPRLRGPL